MESTQVAVAEELSVPSIIKKAGGPKLLCAALNESGFEVTTAATHKWKNAGIPERYWAVVISRTGLRPEEIYSANERARAQAGKPN